MAERNFKLQDVGIFSIVNVFLDYIDNAIKKIPAEAPSDHHRYTLVLEM